MCETSQKALKTVNLGFVIKIWRNLFKKCRCAILTHIFSTPCTKKTYFIIQKMKNDFLYRKLEKSSHQHCQKWQDAPPCPIREHYNKAVQGESNLVILTMRLNKTLYLVYPLNLLTYHNIDFLFLFTNRYFNIPLLCNNICFLLSQINQHLILKNYHNNL